MYKNTRALRGTSAQYIGENQKQLGDRSIIQVGRVE